ncbi:dihydrolipoamide acetyltransferase family protein [Streptomyces sp. ODS28]|uniref:dihydrolipoamide acetyltransferase family protein n=1 Tax=Streptomyces sp. ODS28 TaxID=3136688 RepID=UPI0031E5060D
MAEVREFALPDLGEGLTEATIVRWMVDVGDVVAVDQPVVEVETAKALVEVPCPYAGVVTSHAAEEGAELPVGAALLTVAGSEGASDSGASDSGGADADEPEQESSGSGNVLVGYGTQDTPRRRRRTGRRAAPAQPAEPARPARPANGTATGPGPGPGPVPVISPLVRRLAREQGVDLRELTGSGPEGLIVRADVERAARETAASRTAAAPRTEAPAETRTPLTGIRGATAAKLTRAHTEIPAATCWVDADATELLAAREAMNAGGRTRVPLLALLARIAVAGLARFPELNSTVDTERGEVVRLSSVHLGFAAQTERGLVVPVVRDAHARSTEQLGEEIARITGAAREGALTPGDLSGGTFTLNNYGVFGVDGSTPLVNHPEAAMLGVGRITPKPWAHQGELALRQVVQLSLTFDHRVCDGGTAGGFLRYVADCVEQPALLLRTL